MKFTRRTLAAARRRSGLRIERKRNPIDDAPEWWVHYGANHTPQWFASEKAALEAMVTFAVRQSEALRQDVAAVEILGVWATQRLEGVQ